MWKGYLGQTDLLELIKFANSSFENEDSLERIDSQESVWHFSMSYEVKLQHNITLKTEIACSCFEK